MGNIRQSFHLRAKIRRRLEAQLRRFLQRPQHDLINADVHLHALRWRGEVFLGALAGEHFVKHDAEAVDVRAVIGGAILLLRRGVVGRALRHGSIRPWRPVRLFGIADDLRDAEVRDLHRARFVDEQVLRLDVAMDDAVIVGALQRLADGRHDAERLLRREAFGLQELAQIHAIDELHEQKVEAARLPEVMHADDVRVIQRGERMGLLFKPCRKLRIIRPLRCEQFQRDEAVQRFLPRLVNHAHAATTEAFEDLELRKMRREFLRREGEHGGTASPPALAR